MIPANPEPTTDIDHHIYTNVDDNTVLDAKSKYY